MPTLAHIRMRIHTCTHAHMHAPRTVGFPDLLAASFTSDSPGLFHLCVYLRSPLQGSPRRVESGDRRRGKSSLKENSVIRKEPR